ncbi:MAG: diphthamide synthesis protein [Candidatus Pacearchaeota archaeon]
MIEYDLELKKIIKEIKKQRAKLVLLQLPEALKAKALEIVDEIESKTNAKCLIWIGSCYGACDIPKLDHIKPKIDLLIHFGHTKLTKILK